MNKLKEWIFSYLQRQLPPREAQWPHWDQARHVLIIYQSDYIERNDDIKAIQASLREQGKDVVLWGYVEKKEIQSLTLPQSRIVGPKDFHWWGTPHQELIEDLQKRQFDLLIDLSQEPILALRYLCLYAHADFKAGRHLSEGLHDFMIDMPKAESVQPLYEQIIHYLQLIHSND